MFISLAGRRMVARGLGSVNWVNEAGVS